MLKTERHIHILHELNLHNRVLTASLCNNMKVSEDTIRRDLQELSQVGKLLKVHGGAILPHTSSNGHPPITYAKAEKEIIAKKAATLFEDGSFILSSGGSTIIEFAKALSPDLKGTVMSGSIPAISEYLKHENLDVIVLGDKLNKSAKLTIGPDVIHRLKSVQADVCFLGINAIHPEKGVTDNDWEVVQVKQQMIKSAKKLVCLTISEKLNTVQPIKVVASQEIDVLITELDPADKLLQPYRDSGILVL